MHRQIESYGDPRLYALSIVTKHLAASRQPLVPEQMFVSGGASNGEGAISDRGPLGRLIELLLAEKVGFDLPSRGNSQVQSEAQAVETAS